MIHAIEHGKIGRAIEHDLHWRELFKESEDTLTSSIIERLFYLPTTIFWDILKASCSSPNLPQYCNEIIEKEFWPRWNSELVGENHIEPDVFIRFAEFDLIIEAKKLDNENQQNKDQWEKQIRRYNELFKEDNKDLHYIALSGNRSMKNEVVEKILIHKARWSKLLYATNKELNRLKKEGKSPEIENILKDLIKAFRIHNYFQGTWIIDDSNLNISIDYNKCDNILSNHFKFTHK